MIHPADLELACFEFSLPLSPSPSLSVPGLIPLVCILQKDKVTMNKTILQGIP